MRDYEQFHCESHTRVSGAPEEIQRLMADRAAVDSISFGEDCEVEQYVDLLVLHCFCVNTAKPFDGAVWELARAYPKLTIHHEYADERHGFVGYVRSENGEIVAEKFDYYSAESLRAFAERTRHLAAGLIADMLEGK